MENWQVTDDGRQDFRAVRRITPGQTVASDIIVVKYGGSAGLSALLRTVLEAGLVPVLSPPALAEDGTPVNVNSDRVAGAVAGALGAGQLIFLTGAGGVLDDPGDPATVIADYHLPARGRPLERRVTGGMGIKLMAAREALEAGVGRVCIAGTGLHPLARALARRGGTEVRLARDLSPQSAAK